MYFHQIQYRKLDENNPIESFPVKFSADERDELQKAANAWMAKGEFAAEFNELNYPDKKVIEKNITIRPGEKKNILALSGGGRITGIEMGPADAFSGLSKDLLLEIYWDDDSLPAIYCPVHDLFGYAFGKPSMRSLLAGTKDGMNYSYLPMPFDEKASIGLNYHERKNRDQQDLEISFKIHHSPLKRNAAIEGRLYTEWNKIIEPEKGKPYIFQNSKGKGHHTGTILQAQGLSPGMTLFFEGDDSTIVDNELRIHGTGSEDYFNGGWYALPNRWDMGFNLPIHGCLEYSLPYSRTGGYRFYMADKISYNEQFLHTIEHGPEGNQYPVDYTSLAFYYSDSPPEKILAPEDHLLDVYIPDTLTILPNLMKVTVGINQSVDFRDWTKAVISGNEVRPVVIHMDEIPYGSYKMFLTYEKHAGGSDFSIWQRQQRISEDLNSKGVENSLIENQYIGEIALNDQYQSVSIVKNSSDPEEELIIYSIMLVKSDQDL